MKIDKDAIRSFAKTFGFTLWGMASIVVSAYALNHGSVFENVAAVVCLIGTFYFAAKNIKKIVK